MNRKFFLGFFCGLFFFLIFLPQPALSDSDNDIDDPVDDVTIYFGPETSESDLVIDGNDCSGPLADSFPFDIVNSNRLPSGSSLTPPSIEFFGYRHDLPWIVDIYRAIRPIAAIILIIKSIINL